MIIRTQSMAEVWQKYGRDPAMWLAGVQSILRRTLQGETSEWLENATGRDWAGGRWME